MDNLPSASFFSRHEFLIRRLHSLSGIVPVGAYMCVHLATNATTLAGADTFVSNVATIHSLGPLLPFVEWTFIFLPIIFHAAVGVVIVKSGTQNTTAYPYSGNVRYMLQRGTAWIALFFIVWHVFHMHGWFHNEWWHEHISKPLYGAQFDPHLATSTAYAALAPWWVRVVYGVGVLSCIYHLANGLWTAGITWGLWTTKDGQRRANYVCAGFGILMAVIGLAALVGVTTTDISEAMAVEEVHMQEQLGKLQAQQQLAPTDETAEEISFLQSEIEKLHKARAQLKPATADAGAQNAAISGTASNDRN